MSTEQFENEEVPIQETLQAILRVLPKCNTCNFFNPTVSPYKSKAWLGDESLAGQPGCSIWKECVGPDDFCSYHSDLD